MTPRDRFRDLLRTHGTPPTRPSPLEDDDWLDLDEIADGEPGDDEAARPPIRLFSPANRPLTWKEHLGALRYAMQAVPGERAPEWPEGREILYVVDGPATLAQNGLIVDVCCRDPKKRGGYSPLRRLTLRRSQIAGMLDPSDRHLLAMLSGARDPERAWLDNHAYGAPSHRYLVPPDLYEHAVPPICASGRCWLRAASGDGELSPVSWDDGPPWRPALAVTLDPKTDYYMVVGELHRDGDRMELSAARLLLAGGLVFAGDRVARLDDGGTFAWIAQLRQHSGLRIPRPQGAAFVEALLRTPRLPRIDLPEELRYEEVAVAPRPRLRVRQAPAHWGSQRLSARLSFEYDGHVVAAGYEGGGIFEAARRRFLLRDHAAERAAAGRLRALGLAERARAADRVPSAFDLPSRDLPRVVGQLVRDGWHVEADGKLYRQPGAFNIEITSGVDWFELSGTVDFGGTVARLPELLAALRRRQNTVVLGDGTFGVLPEDWLRRYGVLADLGTPTEDHLRFGHSQVGLLDALLATLPEVNADAVFSRAREELARFQGVGPEAAPPGFVGQLRAYQEDGLGWLTFLRRFGLGGCLADDMGLGKTVQVLALLESRRAAREAAPT